MNKSIKLGWIVFFLCASLWGAPYSDNGNGTVTDFTTGLIWQKCSMGQGMFVGNCSSGTIRATSWLSAITYCNGLILGGKVDWRLPNINELNSIVDYTKSTYPSIDTVAFPNTQSDRYWSSSTYGLNTNNAWTIMFVYGQRDNITKTSEIYVRCVTDP